MSSRFVVVANEFREDPSRVVLVEGNKIVQTFPADGGGGNHAEVASRRTADRVPEGGPPTRGRRPSSSPMHVLDHGGFSKLVTQQVQLGLNAGAPQGRFARDILRTIWMTSRLPSGRPPGGESRAAGAGRDFSGPDRSGPGRGSGRAGGLLREWTPVPPLGVSWAATESEAGSMPAEKRKAKRGKTRWNYREAQVVE